MSHNTKQQNDDFRAAWNATNARWKSSLMADDESDSEPGICPACNGSGEGQHEGTTCYQCKGAGEC